MSRLFHFAQQWMLVFARVIIDLNHLGFGDILGVNATHALAQFMHMQHDLGGLLAVVLENRLQNMHHEFHRGVVIVQQHHLEQRRLLELGLGFLQQHRVVVMLIGHVGRFI